MVVSSPPGQTSTYEVTTTVVIITTTFSLEEETLGAGVVVGLPGQYVVYKETISVVTEPILAGQSLMAAAQEVMV